MKKRVGIIVLCLILATALLPVSVFAETEETADPVQQEEQQVQHFKKLEKRLIPEDFDYSTVQGLRLEARQKLSQTRPASIGQASRISGVSPADIGVLLVYLESGRYLE